MENCALCEKRAWMYCDSDQAKLCWNCDEKVHGANFLVAKHSRTLLCRVCQSPTPWKASGPKLTLTASVCDRCVTDRSIKCEQLANRGQEGEEDDHRDYEDDDGEYDSDEESYNEHDDDDDDEEDEDEEEEGENQVVPWSPPPLASSSNSEADRDLSSAANGANLALKRLRENSFVDSDDDMGCSSSERNSAVLPNDESTSGSNFRPWKQTRVIQCNQSPMHENQTETADWHSQRW